MLNNLKTDCITAPPIRITDANGECWVCGGTGYYEEYGEKYKCHSCNYEKENVDDSCINTQSKLY
jgi:hypothetical protein